MTNFAVLFRRILSFRRKPMEKVKALSKHRENFMKYRFLLRELVRKNIKLQYRDSVLGMFWTFLQPLLTTIVLVFVFDTVFGRSSKGVGNYTVYLLIGRLLYTFFTQSTKRAMRSIRSNASMIKKVYVPKYIYPLSQILSSFITFLISLSVLVFVIAFFNITNNHPIYPTWRIVYCIVPVLILFVLSVGVGMFLAAVNVFFRDMENLYDVITTMLFYATPIVYSIDRLNLEPGSLKLTIFKLNPLYGIIGLFRAAVIWGDDFVHYWDVKLMWYSAACAVIALVVGMITFYKTQDKFILHI